MKNKHVDLIAIANADLAERLTRKSKKSDLKSVEMPKDDASLQTEAEVEPQTSQPKQLKVNPNPNARHAFNRDAWRALMALNVVRYVGALVLLIIITAGAIEPSWQILEKLSHPKLFFIAVLALLVSAVLFTYFSKHLVFDFHTLILMQFSLDVILTGIITHSTGSIESHFVPFYVLAVATGSIVLNRRLAFGLAAGAFLMMFFEHYYSILTQHNLVKPNYPFLANYGILLFITSFTISYLAKQIRIAELRSFIPGDEDIEDFLVREEINALKSALESTEGNKTEAAKLLGMSFRSFRYKLTKYNIE